MDTTGDPAAVSRRAVLLASGGTVGLFGVGSARAGGGGSDDEARCPEATIDPEIVHFGGADTADCADDHPATRELQRAVRASLEERYPTVGALIDRGYVPYFDYMTAADGSGWSHWLNPSFIGDDAVVDPARPESILVDHRWWRPIGVMFIATRDGEQVDPPPAVYGEGDARCAPWHAHVGLPGRLAWLKYQLFYADRDDAPRLSCRTPWMLHVWTYPHPESVYAHDAPPRGSRGGPPAEPAGFETDAVPGEDDLDWEALPDALWHRVTNGSRDDAADG